MRAILLAAGEGSRLRPHTADRPKCLVELGGVPLLEFQLAALESVGIEDVTIVTGYRGDMVRRVAEEREHATVHNERYAETNMVASLMCASDRLDGGSDVVISYADLVYEPRILEQVRASEEQLATVVDRDWLDLWRVRLDDPLSDAETLRMDSDGRILDLGRRPSSLDEIEGQYMGITRVGADTAPRLVEIYEDLESDQIFDGRDRDGMYMTTFLRLLSDLGLPLQALLVEGGWLEVDTVDDLALYERLDREGELDRFCRLRAIVDREIDSRASAR